jgi:hypothetical protein
MRRAMTHTRGRGAPERSEKGIDQPVEFARWKQRRTLLHKQACEFSVDIVTSDMNRIVVAVSRSFLRSACAVRCLSAEARLVAVKGGEDGH